MAEEGRSGDKDSPGQSLVRLTDLKQTLKKNSKKDVRLTVVKLHSFLLQFMKSDKNE